jgi:AraC family transcriptional regulator of adaptative response/methylated-DNA-[protein]-cysteine methyltransferase
VSSSDYQRIEQAILFLERNFHRQPRLEEVARSVHLSDYHFQRLFRRWAGISPKRFLQFLTVEYAKQRLEEPRPVLSVAWEAGLSGGGRLHDLFVAAEAVTPGEFRRRGEGVRIAYGFHDSPFGRSLLGVTERGICALSFVEEGAEAEAVGELRERWSGAELGEDAAGTAAVAARVFQGGEEPLSLHLRGTNFQLRVWEALLRVPAGHLVSYGELAEGLGRAGASRAVGSAVARNPVGWLIPCHRVIRGLGALGGYRWGTARKRAMLGWEAARLEGAG